MVRLLFSFKQTSLILFLFAYAWHGGFANSHCAKTGLFQFKILDAHLIKLPKCRINFYFTFYPSFNDHLVERMEYVVCLHFLLSKPLVSGLGSNRSANRTTYVQSLDFKKQAVSCTLLNDAREKIPWGGWLGCVIHGVGVIAERQRGLHAVLAIRQLHLRQEIHVPRNFIEKWPAIVKYHSFDPYQIHSLWFI